MGSVEKAGSRVAVTIKLNILNHEGKNLHASLTYLSCKVLLRWKTEGIHFHLCTAANSTFILMVGGVYDTFIGCVLIHSDIYVSFVSTVSKKTRVYRVRQLVGRAWESWISSPPRSAKDGGPRSRVVVLINN